MGKELVDSYPSLKRAAFFYISNSCQSPQIPNADFPCRIQLGQSHLAEKAALTCCLLGRYKAIQGPRWWLHRGLHGSQGWSVVKEWPPPKCPGGSQMLFPGGPPLLWSPLRRVPLSPTVPIPRQPAVSSCIWWGVVMATQWANQTWSRRMRGEAGLPPAPQWSIRGVLWEGVPM